MDRFIEEKMLNVEEKFTEVMKREQKDIEQLIKNKISNLAEEGQPLQGKIKAMCSASSKNFSSAEMKEVFIPTSKKLIEKFGESLDLELRRYIRTKDPQKKKMAIQAWKNYQAAKDI